MSRWIALASLLISFVLVLVGKAQNGHGPDAAIFGLLCWTLAAICVLVAAGAFLFWLGTKFGGA